MTAPDAARQIDMTQYRPPEPIRTRWLFPDQIASNTRRTYALMALFVLLITAVVWAAGYLLHASEFAVILAGVAAIVAFGTAYYSYYHSDQLVLRMSRARPATKEHYPHLIHTLEGLCLAAGMRTVPAAYIIDDSAPNAFATGRDPEHAAVAVTTGLLDKLNRYQLEGVLAHELSHVVNRDILLATIAAVMVGMIVLLSDWIMRLMWYGGGRRRDSRAGGNPVVLLIAIVALVLAPLVAMLLQLALSRQREFLADAHAIKLTRYPDGLAGALEVLANDQEPLEVANKATAHLYITNPLKGQGLNTLFSTHPPIRERIGRLRAM